MLAHISRYFDSNILNIFKDKKISSLKVDALFLLIKHFWLKSIVFYGKPHCSVPKTIQILNIKIECFFLPNKTMEDKTFQLSN